MPRQSGRLADMADSLIIHVNTSCPDMAFSTSSEKGKGGVARSEIRIDLYYGKVSIAMS